MSVHNVRTEQVAAAAASPAGSSSGVTLTQTYATADATLANQTSGAIVLTATNIAAKTATLTLTDSAATNPTDANFDQLSKNVGAAYNALLIDFLDLKAFVNSMANALRTADIIT